MALHRRRVQVELPPLTVAAPRAVEADPCDRECAVGGDAEARPDGGRRGVEHAAAHQHSRGLAGVRREVVAVHPDDGRRGAHFLLHVGQVLRRDDRGVGEGRRERVRRTVGPRRGDDVEHDRAVRGELHLTLIGDTGHEQRLRDDLRRRAGRRPCRQGDGCDERGGDEQLADHDPGSG